MQIYVCLLLHFALLVILRISLYRNTRTLKGLAANATCRAGHHILKLCHLKFDAVPVWFLNAVFGLQGFENSCFADGC